MTPYKRLNAKIIHCLYLHSIHILVHFPFMQMCRRAQLNEISALHFLFDMSLQTANTNGLEYTILLLMIFVHWHERPNCDDPRFGRVLLIIELFVLVLGALSLTDGVGELDVDLTNFWRWTGTAVGVLFVEFHVVGRGHVLIVVIVIVDGNLGECPSGPIVVGVNWNRRIYAGYLSW